MSTHVFAMNISENAWQRMFFHLVERDTAVCNRRAEEIHYCTYYLNIPGDVANVINLLRCSRDASLWCIDGHLDPEPD